MDSIYDINSLTYWYSEHKDSVNPPLEKGSFEEQIMNIYGRVCYVLKNEDNGKYKIGYTSDLKRRIQHLQSSSGNRITHVMSIEPEVDYDESCEYIEKKLKEFFKDKKHRGEWYSLGIRDIMKIRNLFCYHIVGYFYDENIH